MAKDFAFAFYNSTAWQRCRAAYLAAHPLCERCLSHGIMEPAKIVHHREWLTPSNINQPEIALSFDNLESLCQDCHNIEHHHANETMPGTEFDDDGNLIQLPPVEKKN